MKPLSNFDIDKIMMKCDTYRGTFSKDMLPKRMNENESAIVNLQDYFEGGGTHWVCIYNSNDSVHVEYFDSFGLVPPNEIVSYANTINKPIIYNNIQIQKMDSILCGYYCLYYILQRNNGRRASNILLDFHEKPTEFNELFMKYFANYVSII